MEVASIGEKWAGLRKTTFMKKITSHNSFEQWWYVGFGKEANVGLRIWGFSNLKEIDNQDRTVSTIVAAQSREEVFKSFEESEKKNHDGHGEICCLKTGYWYAALDSLKFSVQTEWLPVSALHEIKCIYHHI